MSQFFASGGQSIGVSSFNISPSNEQSGLISFRMDWLHLLAVQGTLKSLLQHHSSKASILRCLHRTPLSKSAAITLIVSSFIYSGREASFDETRENVIVLTGFLKLFVDRHSFPYCDTHVFSMKSKEQKLVNKEIKQSQTLRPTWRLRSRHEMK